MAGATHHRLQGVLAEHVRQSACLQGLFEGLETVAVLDLDHIPGLVQQLLEAVPQARSQAIDDCPHRVGDDRRGQQIERAVQRAAGDYDQAFEQRFQGIAGGIAEGHLRLHQQGNPVAPLGQCAYQVVLPGLAAAGGRPGQIWQCPENAHDPKSSLKAADSKTRPMAAVVKPLPGRVHGKKTYLLSIAVHCQACGN
ncbi:hypothetical protein D3C75_831800 [compost metagenome]